MTVSDLLARLADAFSHAHHELYLVGGCVRDELLGRPVVDTDLTTDAEPREVKRLIRKAWPRSSTYDVGERFGTIGAVVDGLRFEITTYRAEEYDPGSRKPRVTFGRSIEDDLARRDFTINAIAREVASGRIIDPFGGRHDLAARRIRAVGVPEDRFREDPLRLLRAVRFAAQLEFTLDPPTRAAIRTAAASLASISRERIAQEMDKLLLAPRPGEAIRALCDLDLMPAIIPDVLRMRGLSQDTRQYGVRYKDVFEHTLAVIDNAPTRLEVRWGALLHDIAKPESFKIGPEGVNFHGHDLKGEKKTRRILEGLRYPREFIDDVATLVRMHLRANSYEGDWTDGAVRRFMREAGDQLENLFDLSRADVTSQRPQKVRAAHQRVDALAARCVELQAQADVAKLASPLDGNDLMTLFGRGPGRWIGIIKDDLLERVIDGALDQDDRETATEIAQRLFAELEASGQVPPPRSNP
ncbi:MAG TPA: CCA tRNA nucleotidyltransferase [Dehalococcoidia bacterium]|nr:CCA tRNA nucleotidyltransferase [Dehalococcoidia bacterium]